MPAFCDFLSDALVGKHAEIELASLALGSQIEAEWLPLQGIVYDSKDDIVEIALDGLDAIVGPHRSFMSMIAWSGW